MLDTQRPTKLQVLTLHECSMDARRLACLCSALPYAQSIHTLQLVGAVLRSERGPAGRHSWRFTKLELSWLAYAIFHPRTKTSSSWRKLAFRNCEFGPDTMETLELMHANSLQALAQHHQQMTQQVIEILEQRASQPNAADVLPMNLLSVTKLNELMHLQASKKKRKRTKTANVESERPCGDTTHNRLWVARTKANATVRADPDSKAAQLVTLQREAELEICDPSTQGHDSWKRVLVPGFGFGWVSKQKIVNIKPWLLSVGTSDPHPSIAPALTSLELNGNFSGTKALLFLVGVGELLEELSVRLYPMPTGFLNKLSLYCPGLKSLSLMSTYKDIRGQALKTFFSETTTRNLESLTLNWQLINAHALQDVLSRADLYPAVNSLKQLHLCDIVEYSHRCRLVQFAHVVLTANETLERVVFSLSDVWHNPDRTN